MAAKIDNYYSKMNEMPNRSYKLVKSQNELDQVSDPTESTPNVKRRQEIGPYNVIAVQKVQKPAEAEKKHNPT